MVSFVQPYWLLGLVVIPVFFAVQKRSSASGLIALHLLKNQQVEKKVSINTWLLIGWVISMIALSGPGWREDTELPSIDNQARIIVVDMSYAMNGTDIVPTRFQQAFYKVNDLIASFTHGYTGVVAYSDQGFTISPLTHDKNTVLAQLQHLSPSIMPSQGQNAARGVEEALMLLSQSGIAYGDIVLITPGINIAEQRSITKLIEPHQYRLSVLAVGTEKGTTFKNSDGALVLGKDGVPVRSYLDEARLKETTKNNKGIYVRYTPTDRDIFALHRFLTANERHDSTQGHTLASAPLLNDGYWFLWPLAILLLAGFRKGVFLSVLFFSVLPIDNVQAAFWQNDNRQGYDAFLVKDYEAAATHFDDHRWKGIALYEKGDFEGAVEAFLKVTTQDNDYNLANALAKLGQYERAGELYRRVLRDRPDHQNAKHNLAVVERAIEKQREEVASEEENPDGNADQQESGDSEGQEERDDDQDEDGQDQGDDSQDNQDDDNDSQGESKSTASSASVEEAQSENNDADDALNTQSSGPQQTQNEGGDYNADIFGSGSIDDDFGTPTDADLEALDHQLAELGEVDPVLNRLSQIKVDPSLLLRNQLILQAQDKVTESSSQAKWY